MQCCVLQKRSIHGLNKSMPSCPLSTDPTMRQGSRSRWTHWRSLSGSSTTALSCLIRWLPLQKRCSTSAAVFYVRNLLACRWNAISVEDVLHSALLQYEPTHLDDMLQGATDFAIMPVNELIYCDQDDVPLALRPLFSSPEMYVAVSHAPAPPHTIELCTTIHNNESEDDEENEVDETDEGKEKKKVQDQNNLKKRKQTSKPDRWKCLAKKTAKGSRFHFTGKE